MDINANYVIFNGVFGSEAAAMPYCSRCHVVSIGSGPGGDGIKPLASERNLRQNMPNNQPIKVAQEITMKQKIITMLELQDGMNTKVNSDWRNAGNEWYRAIWMEASEMLEHHGWKWWKKQQPDVMQVKLEVVDIVHFALSIRLETGEALAATAATIAEDFSSPAATDDIRTTIEMLAKETLIDQGAHFSIIAGVMNHLAMPFDELYEIYVGKNVLNMFRQDNGYKEGTYLKVWDDQREDNEHLADVMKTLDSNSSSFKDDVYQALTDAYPKTVAA